MSRREALHFLNVAHFFDHFFLLVFPTAALAIAPAWAMTYGEALVLGTPIYVMFALGTLPAGWLGDRVDRIYLIILFFLGCGASSLLVALASGPVSLMIALGLLGLFAALYHPVGLALVTDLGVRTGRALAVNGVFGNLGLAGAALVTGSLAKYAGWQSAFAVPGLASLIVGGILLLRHHHAGNVLTSPAAAPRHHAAPGSRRVQFVVFGVICIAALFGGLVFNVVTIALPKFFGERLTGVAGDLSWIGASAGLVFAIAAFAQLPVGELLDRFGARPVLISLMTAQIVLLVCLSQAAGWPALALALALVTMLFAEIPITGWLLGHYVRSGLRARAVSVEYVLSLGMASAAVPLIATLHGAGLGFDHQFLALAVSASVVLAAATFLPSQQGQASAISITAP